MTAVRLAGWGAAALAGAHAIPSVLTVPALNRRLAPRLAGRSAGAQVALTFDDGPDAASTPAFLDELKRLDVRATFFLLGSQLERGPEVARRIADEGHEIAVHGWLHRPHLLRAPWRVATDLIRTVELVRRVTGEYPRFWRPPNGVVTGAGLLATRRLGLQPVLWTADGQDWRADATAASISGRIAGRLAAGGTVLLHDSDVTSAPGSWRAALGAVPLVVEHCRARGWPIGPLADHWPA